MQELVTSILLSILHVQHELLFYSNVLTTLQTYMGSTQCETEKVTNLDQDNKTYEHLAAAEELSMFENENGMRQPRLFL